MASTPKKNLLDDQAMKNILHNATPAHLIDLVAEAREDKSRAEAAEKFLMEALKARLEDSHGQRTPMTDANKMKFDGKSYQGERYTMTFTASYQSRIDTATLRAKYPDAAEECSKDVKMIQARFVKKEPPTT